MSGEDKSKGYWSFEEKTLFLEAVKDYGKNWKKIASIITTRTPNQIRSFAQKLIYNICSKAKMNSFTISKYSLDRFFSVNKTNLSNLTNEEYLFLKAFEKSIPWGELKKKKPKSIFIFSKVNKFSNNPPKLIIIKNESFKIKGKNPPSAPTKSSNLILEDSLLAIEEITKKLDYMSDYIKKHYNNGNDNVN